MIPGLILGTLTRPYVAMGMGAALVSAIIFGGVQTLRVNHYSSAYAGEKTAHANDIAFWKQAGVLAVTRAKESKARIEGQQDKVTFHANDDYRSRLAAFDERVRSSPSTDQRSAGGSHLPSLPYASSIFDGPGSDAVISREDARLCGVNTLRLIAARDWALKQSQIERSPQ